MMTDSAFIALGSNLDSPIKQVSKALKALHQHEKISVQACSSLYESAPMGPQDQANYINAVCNITTALQPEELLDALQSIELAHKRTRTNKQWGPRTLDLDMLTYNNMRIQSDRLTVPHPGMPDREFVLVPLFEIAPDLIMHDGQTLSAWVGKCNFNGLERLDEKVDFSA